MKNNIIIFAFPSHCTHLVQMLDVSFFKSLKSHYKLVCKEWLDEECQDAKPYISKGVFLRLIHRAWINACQPTIFTNGWARMGLSACSTTGMVVINRTAIADFAIGGSEKYSEERLPGSLQAVRVKGGLDTNGVLTYHDYEFDFSADALEQLAQSDPRVYGMHLASRSFLMQQPGMVMHQREVRPCNIAKPLAQVLTTTEGLAAAKAKDDKKNIAVTKRKMTALATIG
jgi:hypothetical protein